MASPVVDVYVKLPSGKVTQINLLPSDPVQKIYKTIADELRIKSEKVCLKYDGKILKKTDTIGYLGICKETILKATIIETKKWKIYVQLPSSVSLPIDIENISSIGFIKQCIEREDSKLPVNKQCLKISNRILERMDQSAMDAGITNEALLTVELQTAAVNVNNMNNRQDLTEIEKEMVVNTFDAAGKNIDVVFSFDTTGSMASCIRTVRSSLKTLVSSLLADIANIRIGLIAHGDYCDQQSHYVLKIQDLTADVDQLVEFAESVPSTGGGDMPEAYEWVLHKAQELDWSADSAKALVMIGDALPHEVSYTDQKINWHTELDILKGMGIKVYGVQAMNQSMAKYFYQELAEKTGGAYINFSNFNILTDMFLAVCYREAEPEQLKAFQDDLEEQGTITDDVKHMIEQLQEAPLQPTEKPNTRYVAEDWWDPQLDHGNEKFTYNKLSDKWSWTPSSGSLTHHIPDSSPKHSLTTTPVKKRSLRFSFRNKRKSKPKTTKQKCILM